MTLDALLRCRLEVLTRKLADLGNPALVSLRAGARSLTIGFNAALATQLEIIGVIQGVDDSIPDVTAVKIPARRIRLPVVFDEAALREANQR
jgi:urea carboxylase